MNLPEFLTLHEYDNIRLTGHRIGLEHVIANYREGDTPEMLHEEFPSLPLELIKRVIAFYEANRAEVDAYVDECERECERLRRENPPQGPTLEELKRRFEARYGQSWSSFATRLDTQQSGE